MSYRVAVPNVFPGQYVRLASGEVIKVLSSGVERQSAASSSASRWEVTGYAKGQPTRRMLLYPDRSVEVVLSPVAVS